MRRAVLAAAVAAAAVFTTACSSTGGDDPGSIGVPAPATGTTGPLPSSQQFDRPFPVAGESWDATVTLSNLRIVPSGQYTDAVVVVDVRAVQASGQPALGPEDFSAFDPSGRAFQRIDSPRGTVDDPLVPSVLNSPGEELRGMVAWQLPRGERIGRIDVVAPRTIGSVTVTRQPVDPTAS